MPSLTSRSASHARRAALTLATLCALALGGCAAIAVATAPAKTASATRTPLALQADALFWQTLHSGRYEDIGKALEVQTAAYLENPRDAVSAAHAGWLHFWRLAESSRLDSVPASIPADAVMARRFFDEAVRLHPGEARYQGFLGSSLLTEGSIHQDEALTRRGYFMLKDSVAAWPEFNLFTMGYSMSRQPVQSAQFREALAMQWETLDRCAGRPIDRQNPDFSAYLGRSTAQGPQRACWNSWIAPHNFEGFFMNMGDMLVKAGEVATARKIYANARLAPAYAAWPYRAMLEQRILDAETNVQAFNAKVTPQTPDSRRLMVQTRVTCMGCHQAGPGSQPPR